MSLKTMDEHESQPLMGRGASARVVDKTPRTICCLPVDWIESYEYTEFDKKNSFPSVVILLLNSMIGSGILVQAYVFKESGIFNTAFVYLVVGFVSYFGASLIARAADCQSLYDVSMLVEKAYGSQGMFWYDLSVCAGNLGSLLSYFLIISTLTVDIVETATNTTSIDGEEWIKVGVTIGCFLFMLPLCLIRNFGHLYYISYISIATIVGTILMVMITSIFSVGIGSTDDAGRDLNLGSAFGTFKTIGSVVFAFGYVQNLLFVNTSAEEELREVSAFDNAIKLTNMIGVILCFLIGFFGYLAFRGDTMSDLLENYDIGAFGIIVKIPFIIHLVLYIPGDFLVFRYSLLKLMGLSMSSISDGIYYTITAVSLIVTVTASLLLQVYCSNSSSLSLVLEITGGLAGSAIGFIFPALVAMRLLPYSWQAQWQISCLFIAGVVIPILVVVSLIYTFE